MNHELIDDDTLDALPDDPGLAFVMFERACRASLMREIEHEDNGNVISSLQLDFMHDVIAAAQHFDVPDIKDFKLPASSNFPWQTFEDFNRRVRFFTTHFRLSVKAQRSRHSVELQISHKDRIRTLVAHLKAAIDNSNMPDWRKDRLRKRILDFESALDGKRLNFADAMVFVGLIGAGLHGIGDGSEGLGKLVHEITVAIGQSKEVEDETRPTLPKPDVKAPVYLIEASNSDEEIPF